MQYDTFVDAWMIAAGAIEAPGEPEEDLVRAASILLALPRLGLMEEFRGGQYQNLSRLGADWRSGAKLLPARQEERSELFRTIFGARRRVIEDLQLQPIDGAAGELLDPLPKSRTQVTDQPPKSAVRRFVEWCLRHGLAQVTEFVTGPFQGQSLDELPREPRQLREALDVADEAWADGASFRLYLGPTSIGIAIPPSAVSDHPFDIARCSAPRGCTQVCPFFGRQMCMYRSGLGWDVEFHSRSSDQRRREQMPSKPGLPYSGGYGERRKAPAVAAIA